MDFFMRSDLLDRHLFDSVATAAVEVDDEEDVADIYADTTLQGGIEAKVGGETLDVAVEGEADEFALGVEDSGTGVTTRDVIVGKEARLEFAVLTGVTTVVLLKIELTERFVDDVVGIVGIFLFHHTAESGLPIVTHSIARFVAAHVAIGHAEGEVGIGTLCPVVHLAEAAHIDAVEVNNLVVVAVNGTIVGVAAEVENFLGMDDEGILVKLFE